MSAGIRFMVLGAFFFSVMSVLVKLVGARIPGQEIVLVRAVVTLTLTYAMLRRAGIRRRGGREGYLILRGILGFAALSCFYYSVIHLPLADATLIQYTNPVWTALLAAWLLGEKMGRSEVALVFASLGGVVLIARPSFLFGTAAAGLDPLVVGVAIAGAIFSAAAYVTVRKLGRTEDPLVIVFYFTLITVPAAIPGAFADPVWPTATEWLILLGVGLTAQAGQVFLTRGLQIEPAGRATAVGYLQVVFAAIWGALFFAEFPDMWSFAGALIIIGSTLKLARKRAVIAAPAVDSR